MDSDPTPPLPASMTATQTHSPTPECETDKQTDRHTRTHAHTIDHLMQHKEEQRMIIGYAQPAQHKQRHTLVAAVHFDSPQTALD